MISDKKKPYQKKKKISQKGETILGVLISVLVFLTISLAVLGALSNAKIFYIFYDKMAVLQELMKLNLVEIENKRIDQYALPTAGVNSCFIRRYNSIGQLLSESAGTCEITSGVGSNFYIIIEIELFTDVSFDNSLMQLPTTSDLIYQFKIKGNYFDTKTSQMKQLDIVYFKGT